jgi:hypothetical protein
MTMNRLLHIISLYSDDLIQIIYKFLYAKPLFDFYLLIIFSDRFLKQLDAQFTNGLTDIQ